MKTEGKINIYRCLTPFISDKEDNEKIRFFNRIMNGVYSIITVLTVLVVILQGNGFEKTLAGVIITLIIFMFGGVLLQLNLPAIKSKVGRKASAEIGPDGPKFKNDEIKSAVFEYVSQIKDKSLDSSQGMGLAKALSQSKLLREQYSDENLALWLYTNFRNKYRNDYQDASIRRPNSKNASSHTDSYKKALAEISESHK